MSAPKSRDPLADAVAVMGALPVPVGHADHAPLSPYYEHPACGFHWHGRDGMDIPMRDGQPVCPRCELAALRARVAELEAAAYGDAEVRLLAPIEQIRHLHACVAAQLARADTLDRLLREYQAAAPPLPVVTNCLGCGEGLDDENISDFCSDRCAENGSTRPVDEDPIAYSLTPAVEALHASSGAVIETPPRPRPVPHDLPEVTP